MNKSQRFSFPVVAAALVFALTSSVDAVPVFFEDIGGNSDDFDMAVQDAGIALTVDDFEDLPAGLNDYGQNLARPGYAITTAGNSGGISLRSTSDPQFVIEGSRSIILYNSTDPMTFTLDAPANAFGITFQDIDLSFGGEFTVAIDNGPTMNLLGPGNDANLVYFFGAIDESEAFSTLTFNRTIGDGYDFDLVSFGIVPEPTSFVLLGVGGVVFVLRRSRTV